MLYYFRKKRIVQILQNIATDPYWDNVVLLSHFDGANQSTTFIDEKGHALNPSYSPSLYTNNKMFGTASLGLNIDGQLASISAGNSDHWAFRTNDFTIEFWFKPTSSFYNYATILSTRTGANTSSWSIGYQAAAQLLFYAGSEIIRDTGTMALNQWYHFAITRKDGVIRGFKNGVMFAQANCTYDFTATALSIGRDMFGEQTTGYIDELRITNGVARYTNNFYPAAEAFPSAGPSYDQFWDNVTMLFPFSAASGLNDVMGNQILQTVNNPYVGSSAGAWDSESAIFNSGYFETSSLPLNMANNDFTIEFRFKRTSSGSSGWSTLMGTRNGPNNSGFSFTIDPSNFIRFAYFTEAADANIVVLTSTGTAVSNNSWYHVAATKSGNNIKLFINGAQVAAASTTLPMYTTTSAAKFIVGGHYYGGAVDTTWTLTGEIDSIRITKGVSRYNGNFIAPNASFPTTGLAPVGDQYWDNVVLLMHMDGADNSTTFTDVKGNSSTAVGHAKLKTDIKKFGGAAAYLDGVGDWISVPDSSNFVLGNAFTIEMWIYPIAGANGGSYNSLIGQRPATELNGWYLHTVNASGPLVGSMTGPAFEIRGPSGNILVTVTSTNSAHYTTLNQWHHIAVTHDGSTIRVFQDGVVTASVNTSIGIADAITNLTIGGLPSTNEMFKGYIDDVRITKGVARYTANFTPSAFPFPNNGITLSYDPYWDDTVLLMNMDSSVTKDESSNIDGTITGNVVSTTGKFGNGALFTGSTPSFVQFPASSKYALGNTFTVECWAKFDALSEGAMVACWNMAFNGWMFEYSGGGQLYFYDASTAANGQPFTPTVGTWYHLAVSCNSGTARMYVNGQAIGSTFTPNMSGAATDPLTIGNNAQGGGNRPFKGTIDGVRITKGIARYVNNFTVPSAAFPTTANQTDAYLGAVTMQLPFDNGSTFDVKKPSRAFTTQGLSGVAGRFNRIVNGATSFGGTTSSISTAYSKNDFDWYSGDNTIEMWVKITSHKQTMFGMPLQIGNRSLTTDSNYWSFGTNSSGNIKFYYWNGAQNNVAGSSAVPLNTWTHLAMCKHGNQIKLFINGALEVSATVSGTPISGTDQPLTIGYAHNTSFNGTIDDLRITRGVARYTASFSKPTSQFATPPASPPSVFDKAYYANVNGVKSSETALYSSLTTSWGGNAQIVTATPRKNGKWYYESRVTDSQHCQYIVTHPGQLWYSTNPIRIGICHTSKEATGVSVLNGGTLTTYSNLVDGIVYGVLMDLESRKITIMQQGQVKAEITNLDSTSLANTGLVVAYSTWNMAFSTTTELNLGQNPFTYSIPSGYYYLDYPS